MANDEGPMGTSAPSSNGAGKRAKSAARAFGQSMQEEGQREMAAAQEGMQRSITQRESDPGLEGRQMAEPSSYRRGGKVRRGGIGRLHKGERVLTRAQQVKLKKRLRVKRGRM